MIFYTTGCPQCRVLCKKLKAAGFDFEKCEDVDTMRKAGFTSVPVLELDNGERLGFAAAIEWLRERE